MLSTDHLEPGRDAVALPLSIIEPKRLGRVVSVSGGRIVVLLQGAPGGDVEVQVGALVKILRPSAIVCGIVEGMSVPIPRPDGRDDELRVVEVNLLGEVRDGSTPGTRVFCRGVSSVPCLGDSVLVADSDDTAAVYALRDRPSVHIGTVHQDPSVPACISVDDLLGRHFAVVGATGSGKSCALALLLDRIVGSNPDGHILVLDPHGEYGQAFGDRAEHLTFSQLQLPYWALAFEEISEVFFGSEKEAVSAEIQCLRQLVLKARVAYAGRRDAAGMSVDTPAPYTLSEMSRLIDEEMGRMDNRNSLGPYHKIKARLAALQADPHYAFLFPRGIAMRDTMSALLGQLFRIPARGKPICVLDLLGAPAEVLNVVVAVVCRMAFDLAVMIGQRTPMLLVCEEAHRYAPQDTKLGFEPAKRSLSRIAKEGRKYGLSLGVISQRPSDLDVSVLSQCGTVISFRMVNEADQAVIQAALTDMSAALVTSLPLLGNGEAVVVGEGVSVPMRLRLTRLQPDQRPRSSSASFSQRWQGGEVSGEDLDQVVNAWRSRPAL